jgi:xanthine dehydrogenase YagT iron-sulfur-binding subunit
VPRRHLTINGRAETLDVPDHATLLEVLRDRLHLAGAKPACERGECGACTVLLDDRPAYACLALAAACEGRRIVTVEGLGDDHPVPAAFARHDAAQCGYCTPGQVMAATALLAADPAPSDDAIVRAMSGNLCRCGTYPRIKAALRELADAGHGVPPR